MTEHSGGFDADLCVSTKPVIIGLSVVGTVLLFLSNTPRSIGDRHAVVPFFRLVTCLFLGGLVHT